MHQELPEGHGLDERVQLALVHRLENRPSVTDVQYEALAAGVGRGESALVLAPTSTGKTQIALWAMALHLFAGGRVVYLVTHRALAKQKFYDLLGSYLLEILGSDKGRICVATGDEVICGDGVAPKDPLQVDVLVATYEKYLALISGGGVPTTLASVCVVCDEVQLIGDAHRGQSVEVLLTLLKRAGWGQLVALSAVLSVRDASELADWLGVSLVIQTRREKHLRYECWSSRGVLETGTDDPGRVVQRSGTTPPARDCIGAVRYLLSLPNAKPIIVFCMKKDDTARLARELIESGVCAQQEQLSFEFLDMPETNAVGLLRDSLTRRVAVHNADLTDEERAEVEKKLIEGAVDVVFATSSLAAGVNFPFATAVFSTWERWNSSSRAYEPIDPSEFHNMAGRAGRMGFNHEQGRVIFFPDRFGSVERCRAYLDLALVEHLEPRIEPSHFPQLALQLVASGICSSTTELVDLIANTFSGLREADRNATGFAMWPAQIKSVVDTLLQLGHLNRQFSGRLIATPVGKASAHSGLQPATTQYLLSTTLELGETLASWLPGPDSPGRADDLVFALARICFSSPEFADTAGARQTRWLPWPLQRLYVPGVQPRLQRFNDARLAADADVLSASALVADWVNGSALIALESAAPNLSAGMIRDLIRNLSWALQGLSSVLEVATDIRVPHELRPVPARIEDDRLQVIRRLPRYVGRLVRRLHEGLPESVLWMLELNGPTQLFRLTRDDVLRLRDAGITSPGQLMAGDQQADAARVAAFPRGRPSPHAKANWARDRARAWKSEQRQIAASRQARRARSCPARHLLDNYYSSAGTQFEAAFEGVLSHLGIAWHRLDDRSRVGAPDYLVHLIANAPLVIELKTREQDRLVDYNRAVEVLAASEVHGYRDAFCVTLCHPGVDPSVPAVIAQCGRLAVVESHDLGEALLRLCEKDLDLGQLHRWLTTPGQATASDLPFKEQEL